MLFAPVPHHTALGSPAPHRQRPPPPTALLPVAAAIMLCTTFSQAWAQLPPPVVSPGQMPAYRLGQAYPVYPRISINGANQENAIGFFAVGDTIYTTHAALQGLGIQLGEDECQAQGFDSKAVPGLPAAYFPLSQCTLLQHRYAAATQRLELQAPITRLNLPTTQIGAGQGAAPSLSRPDFSAVYNYDASVSGSSGANNSKGLYSQIRLGTPYGFFESNHAQTNALGKTTHQRMDTFWRSVWPEQGITLTVGDTYSSQLASSSGARMGGIQVASSYNTRPWYQKLPQTLFSGSTELPSSVDLYLNGVKQYTQNVNAGPYEITLPPTVSGTGNAQIITRDALGRQTVVEVPLYDTAELLAPGLQEWSVEAGKLRLTQGSGKQYDSDALMSASLRRGLLPRLTGQIHAEAKRNYHQAGLALRASPGFPTQIGLQWSTSQYQGKSGQQYQIFAVQQGNNWSLSAGANQSSAQFASLGDTTNSSTPFIGRTGSQKQAYVQLGWGNAQLGSFSLGRVWARQILQKQDVWSLNWNKQLNSKTSLMAAASYDERNPKLRTGMVGLSIQLGNRISASAYANEQNGQGSLTAQVQKSAQNVGDWGWNVGGQSGSGSQRSANAGVQTISQYGDGSAIVRSSQGGQNSWQANWRGGLVLIDGHASATRTVYDSFALVSTNGAADLPIKAQNSLIGKTNSRGQLLLPNLMAYQNNSIALDSSEMPANLRINNSRQTLIPYERSGYKIGFDVQQQYAWMASVQSADGKNMPVGASLLNPAGQPLGVVGFDGRVYVEMPKPADAGAQSFRVISANAQGQTQECRLSLHFDGSKQATVQYAQDFGVVVCKP